MGGKDSVIKDKSFAFALRIAKLFRFLCEAKKEYIMGKQLMRSGTAVGAMVREAEHAESSSDFVHKMAVAQKECNESGYWLDLLHQSGYLTETEFRSIAKDQKEIAKILSSIILTMKKKDKKSLGNYKL